MRLLSIFTLLLLSFPSAWGLEVIEEDGGFKFELPDGFELRPNRGKAKDPATQFDIFFSRDTRTMIVPSGWRSTPQDKAVDATIKLVGNSLDLTATDQTKSQHSSRNGIEVTKYRVACDGEIPFVFLLAFPLAENILAVYTVIPGDLSEREAARICDAMISSLQTYE